VSVFRWRPDTRAPSCRRLPTSSRMAARQVQITPRLWTVSCGACGSGILHVGIGWGIPLSAAIRRTAGRGHARARSAALMTVGETVKLTSAALLALSLAASTLLAGCGGDPKPAAASSGTSRPPATATPTTSASPTATPRTTDPNIPAAARAHTPAGAEAFVRYFYAQVNSAWTKPTSGLIPKLSSPNCKSCAALEATASGLVKSGQRYNGPPATIVFIGHLGEGTQGHPEVLVRLMQEHRSVIDRSGHVVLTDQREPGKFVATVRWSGRGWSIEAVKSLA